ncbi:MAG: YitT family protein [Oscillospiraceae bacterium]|nr:YitT family protein [Oscillospiraceae bacterium]
MDKFKRYLVFLAGLFISSFGVSFITKASLGTSPISSIPYVLSLKFSPTLGEFTIIFSVFLVVLQIFILRKNFRPADLIQLPVSVLFGYFIDFTMKILNNMNPESYILKFIDLLIGCIILAFGVYLEVIADVAMLPGEAFVRSIVRTFKKNFGNTKIIFDASMCITAGVLSFVFFSGLEGVREGTVVSALTVGFIMKFFVRIFHKLPDILFKSA